MNSAATYLAGLPAFLAYFGTGAALLALFAFTYSAITPHHEWKLIRANQPAAAVAFSGSLLGFVLPLHSAISHSINLIDCIIWGVIAFLVQIGAFFVIRIVIRDLPERITNNEMAPAVLVAAISVAVGILNAASMTY